MEKRRKLQAVFFDFDGVIVDSCAVKKDAFRKLFVDYPHRQLSRTTDFSGGVDLILGPGDTRIVVWPQVVDDEFWRIIEGGNSWFGKNIDTNLASWQ